MMTWIRKHWRGWIRFAAAVLFGAGLFCGYWWFYKLAPLRKTLDSEWVALHAPRVYWREVQKGIHRGMWFHDDAFTVGLYGDKVWAEWIMARVEPGTGMGCVGEGLTHSATAMKYITNHDLGEEANAWLSWWRENKSKTQVEWIADGFGKHGFEISLPPGYGQVPVLLKILGNPETNAEYSLPGGIKYNAFRALRDSGFNPVEYALEHSSVSSEIKSGLIEYLRMERLWPSGNGIGILSFGSPKDDLGWEGRPLPPLVTTRFQVIANAIVFGLPVLGAALFLLSVRQGHAEI
ncbi:MAG: hypothetical protein JJU05_19095 [Verrucomicrobia bacterium]|nr:hypothetical protein [Verrucomicrobiota bacterium]MCH8528923.1 hypothetical protein [Kiritimatiellia bacterium]